MIIRGTDLTMIRGDTEVIKVTLVNHEDEDEVFIEGDKLYFTVKENVRRDEPVVEKVVTEFEDGEAFIEIDPEDTHHLRPRDNYVYDIQLTQKDGTVSTIVPPSNFTLIGDVTRE